MLVFGLKFKPLTLFMAVSAVFLSITLKISENLMVRSILAIEAK
jgi:hypothetical protein